MECIYCGAHLEDDGPYGYLALHQSGEVLGTVYKCPNHDGFQNESDAKRFLEMSNKTLADFGANSFEDIACESGLHYVSGSFYTDKKGELHTGYPC